MTLRFGTDGVRGVALTELTPGYVLQLGMAAAGVLGRGTWLLGRDPRRSGAELGEQFSLGLRVAGATVHELGVVPTPALAHLSATEGVPAAMITASHNPWTDNGVKIFAAGGLKLPDEVEAEIESLLGARVLADGSYSAAVPARTYPPAVRRLEGLTTYANRLVGLFGAGALAGMHVVLDAANGAMSEVAPAVFEQLGAQVKAIHAAPDGRNINDGCGATAPGQLAEEVVRHGAQLGLAFDGDGDRVIAADHLGGIVDGDHLIALSAIDMRAAGELVDDTVVVTVMSNLGFRLAMERAGITVVETGVGDRYVLEALDAGGLALGGEQSGHIIYRKLATTGDGLLAGLRLAHLVHRAGRPLAELAAAAMTTYPQVLVNVRVAERHPAVAQELAAEIAAAERELGGDGRILVRASGTEPLVRVMVEAATEDAARRVADGLADVVRARFA